MHGDAGMNDAEVILKGLMRQLVNVHSQLDDIREVFLSPGNEQFLGMFPITLAGASEEDAIMLHGMVMAMKVVCAHVEEQVHEMISVYAEEGEPGEDIVNK